jgi:hypothetical protein
MCGGVAAAVDGGEAAGPRRRPRLREVVSPVLPAPLEGRLIK